MNALGELCQVNLLHKHRGNVKLLAEGEKAEGKEKWWELFYDLLFVAVCIRLGEIVTHGLSFSGIVQSFTLFSNYYAAWCTLSFYFTYANTDVVYYVFGFATHFLTVFASLCHLDVSSDQGYEWDVSRSGRGFAIWVVASRLPLLFFHLEILYCIHTKKEETNKLSILHPGVIATAGIFLSMCMWSFSQLCVTSENVVWIWLFASIIEVGSQYTAISLPSAPRVNCDYFLDRLNALVLITFGESIIQLATFSEEDTSYSRSYLIFLLVNMTVVLIAAVTYFSLHKRVEHALAHTAGLRVFWTCCIWPFSFCVMLYGHSIEAIAVTNMNVEAAYNEYLENVESLTAAIEEVEAAEEHPTKDAEITAAERTYDSYLHLYGDCGNNTESWSFTECACDSDAGNLIGNLRETCEYVGNYSLYFKAELLALFVSTTFLLAFAAVKRTLFSNKPVNPSTSAAIFLGTCCAVSLLVLALTAEDIDNSSAHYMLLASRIATYAVFLLGMLLSFLWMLNDEKTSHTKESGDTPDSAGFESKADGLAIIELKDINPVEGKIGRGTASFPRKDSS